MWGWWSKAAKIPHWNDAIAVCRLLFIKKSRNGRRPFAQLINLGRGHGSLCIAPYFFYLNVVLVSNYFLKGVFQFQEISLVSSKLRSRRDLRGTARRGGRNSSRRHHNAGVPGGRLGSYAPVRLSTFKLIQFPTYRSSYDPPYRSLHYRA